MVKIFFNQSITAKANFSSRNFERCHQPYIFATSPTANGDEPNSIFCRNVYRDIEPPAHLFVWSEVSFNCVPYIIGNYDTLEERT